MEINHSTLHSYTSDLRSSSMIVTGTEEVDPIVTVGLVEVMDTMKSSLPSAILSAMVAIITFIALSMVAIITFIVPPGAAVPEANVTVKGVGSVKSAVAV